MTTISDLTPVKLSVADVGAASTAMAHACHMNLIGMHHKLWELSPDAAREVWLAAEIFTATARARALGHGRPAPPLLALAVMAPDDLRLPKEES